MSGAMQFLQVQGQLWAPAICTGAVSPPHHCTSRSYASLIPGTVIWLQLPSLLMFDAATNGYLQAECVLGSHVISTSSYHEILTIVPCCCA